MNSIDLSVIIPVYNAALLLNRCLDSIFQQSTSYSVEVIMVDDGSTDNSVELIRARKEANIHLYQQKNSGPSVARNVGIEHAQGRYAAFLDADDYWKDGFIEKTISFLDEHTECVGVSVGQKHVVYGAGNIIKPDFLKDENDKQKSFVIDDFYSFWAENDHICTGSMTMRTSILKQTGGQRSDLRICEDIEFWLVLASYGKIGLIPEVLFVADGGAIVAHYGWKKYVNRFQNIPSFESWMQRIVKRLNSYQMDLLTKKLNDIVCGISRAKICGGDFCGSYKNIQLYKQSKSVPLIVKIANNGLVIFTVYAFLYRGYQFIKINRDLLNNYLFSVFFSKFIFAKTFINKVKGIGRVKVFM